MSKRTRRSYPEMFLDKLGELSNGGQRLIGNKTLREALGWDESRYNAIKTQLRAQNLIIVRRGKGGSVGLADAPGSKALNVFISYSHADEPLRNELVRHLEPLKKLNLVETWHDRKLKAGDEWDKEISRNLQNADLILLLVKYRLHQFEVLLRH